jgi:AcrR family transcriptional regulator
MMQQQTSGADAPLHWHTGSVPAATPLRPLRRDAQANRDKIVAAARDAFAAEGIGVPVEKVARQAGVGMGTLYRHFATKEDLVDAVFEDTLAELAAVAHEALAMEDAWAGFCSFLERAFLLHAENRGLKDVVLTRSPGRAKAEAARVRLRPLIAQLVERAQEQGTLRRDFSAADVPVLFWMVGRVIAATSEIAPDFWRRQLGFVLDGLRADAATPLPHAPLTRAQLDRASGRRP